MNDLPSPERRSDEDQANQFSQETHPNQNPIEQLPQETHLAHPRKEQNLLSNINARDITVERIVQTTEEHYYPSPSPPAPELKGIPQNLPRGSANFVGRDELLTTLHQELQKSDRATITAVIAGMGGVGKTEMAVQYAHRYLEDYSGGVCWLHAREGDLETQIIRFVGTILRQQVPVDLSTSGDRLQWCWNYWRSSGIVLLILDDVTDFAACQTILAELPARFRVLLTTRQRAIAPYYELPLDVLSEDAALELLMRFMGEAQIAREQKVAKQLCHWLGYLPLGIELVGSYIKEKLSKLSLDDGLPLAKMLHYLTGQYSNEQTQSIEEAQRAKEKALNQTKPGMTAQRGVRSAFGLSWQELDLDAAEIALLVGLFAPDDIPLRLVMKTIQHLGKANDATGDAIQQLENLYLIQPVEVGKRYKVHPLIREFLHEKLKRLEPQKREELTQAFAIEITKIAQSIPSSDDIEIALKSSKLKLSRQKLLEQLRYAMPHLAELAKNWKWTALLTDDWSASFVGLARFYEAQDMYIEAQKWHHRFCEVAQQRFGKSHSDIATGLYNQARCYCQLGRYAEAKPLYQKALKMRQNLLDTNHPEVAASLNGLAAVYHAEGRYSDAEPLYQQALQILQQLHGVAHADVIKTLSNLAALHRNQSRFDEAELIYQQLFDQEDMLPQSSFQALRADNFSNRAGLYTSQKRYDEAESLYQQAKAIYQQLGENRPQFADILSNLGRLYLFKQQYSEAEELFVHALEIRQRLPDRNDRDIATCLYNLGNTCQLREIYDQAEDFYRQALDLRRKSLGDHPDVVTSLTSLSELYYTLNRLNEVESLHKETIDLRKRLQGDHPDVAASLDALVDNIYRQQGRWKDAEPLLAEALEVRQRLLNHSNVTVNEFARSHYRLALSYFFQGQLPDAQALFERAQQLWQQVPLEEIDAPSVADNLYGLSLCYIHTTESLFKQAKDWHDRLYGSSNRVTLKIAHELEKLQDTIKATHLSEPPAPPTQPTPVFVWVLLVIFAPIWIPIAIIWVLVSKCFELLKQWRKTER